MNKKILSTFYCLIIAWGQIYTQEIDRNYQLGKEFHISIPKQNQLLINIWSNENQLLSVTIDTTKNDCCALVQSAYIFNYTTKYKYNSESDTYVTTKHPFNKIKIDSISSLEETLNRYKLWRVESYNFDSANYNYHIKDGCSYNVEIISRKKRTIVELPNLFFQNSKDSSILYLQNSIYEMLSLYDFKLYYYNFLSKLKRGLYRINSTLVVSFPADLSNFSELENCIQH